MVKLERVFLSLLQGLASSSHRVWPVSMFYLMEVYPLRNVEHCVSVGLSLPHEKHGRADVVRARSEEISTVKFPVG